MEITGSLPSSLNLTAAVAQLQNLRIGQLLQAVVIRQVSSETVLLQLLNTPSHPATAQQAPQQLLAETSQPLTLGQRLQLEVSQLGERPVLKVLAPPQPPASTPLLNQALMQALPRQSGMAPLLANLSWINQPQNSTVPLPQAVQVLAKALFDKLPSREKISSAEGLKQAIEDSGLFLENRLARAAQRQRTPDSGADLKSLLLHLLNTVQREAAEPAVSTPPQARPALPALPAMAAPPPPMPEARPQPQGAAEATLATLNTTLALLQELGKQAEGSIARTQLHQLASLPAPDQNPLSWSFELPIRHQDKFDLFQFVIEEHKGKRDGPDEPQRRWSVTLAFELEGLGPLHARLQLENGKIGTTFWAGAFDTSTLISQNLTDLAQRYQQAGLESGELRCFQGQPPVTSSRNTPRVVLDLKA